MYQERKKQKDEDESKNLQEISTQSLTQEYEKLRLKYSEKVKEEIIVLTTSSIQVNKLNSLLKLKEWNLKRHKWETTWF